MPKQVNYTLNPDELEIIETTPNHDARPEVRQRATAIRLLHLGHLPDAVAEMLAVTAGSVYNWHRRWKRAGLEGLANEPKSGRPSKANDAYIRLLEETLDKDLAGLGLDFVVWTINRLRLYLAKQTGILTLSLAARGLGLCLSATQTRPDGFTGCRGETGRGRDSGLAQKKCFDGTFECLFMDETTVTLHPPLPRCELTSLAPTTGGMTRLPGAASDIRTPIASLLVWNICCSPSIPTANSC
jgi:transposase